jgi:ATP-dependent RNA helicase RhlE
LTLWYAPFTKGDHLNFSDLLLSEPILRAVLSEGYTVATPIQAAAIPHALAGRDVLGCAQTGTGKTAAFALPILHQLSALPRPGGIQRPRCLVLCPTRELATQIADSFRVYGKNLNLKTAVVYGGVGIGPQADALRRGVDILIATPGRLLDLLGQRLADLRSVEILVLDEADRMLDMGFIVDIRKIIAMLSARKQTLLFSATMANEIRKLAGAIMRDPATVQVERKSATADGIDQSVYMVSRSDKPALLVHLVNDLPMSRSIVFTRTKHGADRLVRKLHGYGLKAEAIHGNKSQNQRQRALDNFRVGRTYLLIATDVASRGIDVDGISHVVNYDLTDDPETYVHRIGRTARAGASGAAISFCDSEETSNLRAIERLIRRPIPVKKAAVNLPSPKPEIYPEHSERHSQRHSSHESHPRQSRQQPRNQGHAPSHSRSQGQSHSAHPRAAHPQAAAPQSRNPARQDRNAPRKRHPHPVSRHNHRGSFQAV